MKKIILKVFIVAVFIGSLVTQYFIYKSLKLHEVAITNLGGATMTQQAAWQVLLSTLRPEDREAFLKSVDEIIKK